MNESTLVYGRKRLAREMLFLCVLVCVSAYASKAASQESELARGLASARRAAVATPSPLQSLVDEALSRSPIVRAARSHWQAQTKVPIQAATLPDPQVSLQHFTVGSPQRQVPGDRGSIASAITFPNSFGILVFSLLPRR